MYTQKVVITDVDAFGEYVDVIYAIDGISDTGTTVPKNGKLFRNVAVGQIWMMTLDGADIIKTKNIGNKK